MAGDTLTTNNGTWTGTGITYTYQWRYSPSGSAISGATGTTYVIQVGDTGSLVYCVITATNTGGMASANSNVVGPLNAVTTYDGFAATHGNLSTHRSGITNANVRSGHWARTNITQLKIVCHNYLLGESVPGATMGVTASVEYPPRNLTQILFSASSSGTAPNGGTLISDYVTPSVPIPNGDRFWIRLHQTCSVGLVYLPATAIDTHTEFMGDCYEDSATDRTMTGEVPAAESSVAYYPVVIAPMTTPSVLILGDSIDAGVADVLDADGDMGIIARTVGPQFGYFNAAMASETAAGFVSSHTQRLLLSNCTHVFVGHGTNDIFAGDSKTTIEGNLNTIYGLCSGKTVFQRTMVPRTQSSNGWIDTVNQTVGDGSGGAAAHEAVRVALNADLRSSFAPTGGVFDVGAAVETSAKWIANKTSDGTHPNYAGYQSIKASGAINTSLIGTPATPATETGSAWGDHGTKITLSTRRRANDTAIPDGTSSNTTARGASGNSSGLKYFELELLRQASLIMGLMTGAASTGAALDDYVGSITDSFGLANGAAYAPGGSIFTPTSVGAFTNILNAGDVFGWAVDFTSKFVYLHRNGVWFLSGNPASGGSGTGNVARWTGTPTLYPGLSLYGNSSVRLRTGTLLYPLPGGGYSAWG